MKKLLVAIAVIAVLFTSCNSGITSELGKETTVLPNGYVLSSEEEASLLEFAKSKGYVDNNGRAVKDEFSDDEIDEMIQALKDEYGELAENYYGEIKLTSQEDLNSRKAGSVIKHCYSKIVSIPLSSNYSNYQGIIYIDDLTCVWGLWWCRYKNIEVSVEVKLDGTTTWLGLECDSISWTYTDPVTTKTGTSTNSSYFIIGKSNAYYGWLPEMCATITAVIKDDWIKNNSTTVTLNIITE